jgi:hypothetical protein
MARYLSVEPLQEPFDGGTEGTRAVCLFNVQVEKTASDTFLEELAARLVANAVAPSANIFTSSKAVIPPPPQVGPFIMIRETGGRPPVYIHDQPAPAYPRPAAIITVYHADYAVARATARKAYNALASVRNAVLTP